MAGAGFSAVAGFVAAFAVTGVAAVVDLAAFFFDPSAYPVDVVTGHFDWARTFGASRDGSNELAGIYTSYDMAVTAPGALGTLTRVPMAGLSWVSVHPDHRRRGVLRDMMTHHFARMHEQGVALSGLHAAEVQIYGRFGYEISSVELELELAPASDVAEFKVIDRCDLGGPGPRLFLVDEGKQPDHRNFTTDADERVAVHEIRSEIAERQSRNEAVEPQPEPRQLDGHLVLVNAVDAALQDNPAE